MSFCNDICIYQINIIKLKIKVHKIQCFVAVKKGGRWLSWPQIPVGFSKCLIDLKQLIDYCLSFNSKYVTMKRKFKCDGHIIYTICEFIFIRWMQFFVWVWIPLKRHFLGTPVSFANKTDSHDIPVTEILFKIIFVSIWKPRNVVNNEMHV